MNDLNPILEINGRKIGDGQPVYCVAELSANHHQDYNQAVQLIHVAKEAGADAIKLQTYTPDTITINIDSPLFRHEKGSLWEGRTLYDLYQEAYTPWEWQPKLKTVANDLGLDLFSTPFDKSAVQFLEKMDVPAYKIASFEIIDIGLIQNVARTGKPIIMSTGMATHEEIDEAVKAAREAGANQIALLKCNSAYPAPAAEMNLNTIPQIARDFGVVVGLSDHTLGISVAVAAVALGARIIEKHLTLSRSIPGPDCAFSLEPHEFKNMVNSVREAQQALGKVCFEVSEHERASRVFRRSLFVVEDMKAGDSFTEKNVRSIRPGHGLAPKYLSVVLGKHASQNIPRGTPLDWVLISKS